MRYDLKWKNIFKRDGTAVVICVQSDLIYAHGSDLDICTSINCVLPGFDERLHNAKSFVTILLSACHFVFVWKHSLRHEIWHSYIIMQEISIGILQNLFDVHRLLGDLSVFQQASHAQAKCE